MTVADWPDATRSLDAYDLTGKRALVVGAGSGAGAAIALALAQAGADLALSAATNDANEMLAVRKTAKQARDLGRTAIDTATDAATGQGAQVLVRQVAKELGGIDVLVNAPGLPLMKPATKITDADWARVVAANLSATFFACRAAGKEMLKSERKPAGRVINVASVLGGRGMANASAYCAAQAGILNLTRALAQEWAADAITVNAIALGWIEGSPVVDDAVPDAEKPVRFIPMKRTGRPAEAGPLAVYLASDASGYVTGQVLTVDGGLTVHL